MCAPRILIYSKETPVIIIIVHFVSVTALKCISESIWPVCDWNFYWFDSKNISESRKHNGNNGLVYCILNKTIQFVRLLQIIIAMIVVIRKQVEVIDKFNWRTA